MDKISKAKQINRAFELFAQSLQLSETHAMEIADLYPEWEVDKQYEPKIIVKYGVNADGETQLYAVQQAHKSQADWKPDVAASLFKKVGFTADATPIWTQPLGGHDAYQINDVVSHKGTKYKSTANSNVWEPGVYGWVIVPA